jgi:hypothetical protein
MIYKSNSYSAFSRSASLKPKLIFCSSVAGFLGFIFVSVFLLSSCGFIGAGGPNFVEQGSELGGPGDGDTPRLASRLRDNPGLADRDCEESDRCKETCRYIYEDSDSYRECYELTIEIVVRLEEVFHALFEADIEDLEDIDEDDLEDYLEIGLDGWKDKVIGKQKLNTDRNDKFESVLEWIWRQENKVVSILQREDRSNDILKELFLGHCNLGTTASLPACGNGSLLSSSSSLFGYSAGTVSYNGPVALIEDRENKELFLALIAGGEAFFEKAAGDRRFDAFALGNDLVERACTHRSSTSVDQCIAAFYCHLRHADNNIYGCGSESSKESCIDANWSNIRDAGVGEDTDLYNECRGFTNFPPL